MFDFLNVLKFETFKVVIKETTVLEANRILFGYKVSIFFLVFTSKHIQRTRFGAEMFN